MSTSDRNNELPVWEIMSIGSNLEVLRRVTSQTPIKPSRRNQLGIADRLRMLQKDMEALEFSQSERVLGTELDELLEQIEADDRSSRLENDAVCIRQIINSVGRALAEEGNRRKAFVALRDREGQIESLLSDPATFFGIPVGGILELTPQGDDDFREAARCYAVGFTAASIMFMLRATEDVLRSYYHRTTQQPASGAWGNLTTTLKIPVLRCPSALLTLLDKLVKKRNEAMHPKTRIPTEWDEGAARQVLQDCREAIRMMIEDLEGRNP